MNRPTRKGGALLATAAAALCLMILTGLFVPLTCSAGSMESVPLSHAKGVYLYNIENGRTLASKNADALISPGSTVKIMTGLIVCEAVATRLDEKITVTTDMISSVEGRYAGLRAGTSVSVRDLVYMAFCGSYNDAVMILETFVAGSNPAFINLMNSKARSLGMSSTYYTNATGVDNDFQTTSVSDLALLALAAMKNELLMTVTSAIRYETESLSKVFDFPNNNWLHVSGAYRNPICKGLNAGSTPKAGYSCVTVAEKDGLSYLCIVTGADIDDYNNVYSYIVTNKLINWALDSYGYVDIVRTSDVICEIPVTLSLDVKTVLVVPERTVTMYLPLSTKIGEDVTWVTNLTAESLEAPVSEGSQVGFLTVYIGDEKADTVALVTKTSVTKSQLLSWLDRIREFTKGTFFRATVICAASLTLLYIIIKAFVRASGGRPRRRRFR